MIRADSYLIEAARSGDAAALSRLLQVCQPDLKRFARRTCATSEDAEDAVQLALWHLYRKVGALRTVAAFGTWLFRIVERECYRLFGGRLPVDEVARVDPDAAQAPGLPLDLRADLTRAIAELPATYRDVLILRDVEELTAPEVAAHLNVSVEAVKSRLHRARGMVRERLLSSGYWLKDAGGPQAGRKGTTDVL